MRICDSHDESRGASSKIRHLKKVEMGEITQLDLNQDGHEQAQEVSWVGLGWVGGE